MTQTVPALEALAAEFRKEKEKTHKSLNDVLSVIHPDCVHTRRQLVSRLKEQIVFIETELRVDERRKSLQ